MKDLVEKVAFVKSEVLSRFHVGDLSREWYVFVFYVERKH